MPIREIERRTGFSRTTVRKHLRAAAMEPMFKVPDRSNNLDPCGAISRKSKSLERNWVRQERGETLLTAAQHDFCDEPIDCSDPIRNPFACRLDEPDYGNKHNKIYF